jgi:hypothetical protein
VQLEEFPSPEFMFSSHPYITGINKPVVDHFKRLSRHIVDRFQLEPSSLVLDIGCNDGTLLSSFADLGMRVLGVDPGTITGAICKGRGINVCETFWNLTAGKALRDLKLIPRLITAAEVKPSVFGYVVRALEGAGIAGFGYGLFQIGLGVAFGTGVTGVGAVAGVLLMGVGAVAMSIGGAVALGVAPPLTTTVTTVAQPGDPPGGRRRVYRRRRRRLRDRLLTMNDVGLRIAGCAA